MKRLFLLFARALGVTAALALNTTPSLAATTTTTTTSLNETRIDSVEVDFTARTVTLIGVRFAEGSPSIKPYVELGGIAATVLSGWTASTVAVAIPSAFPMLDGEYQIYLERKLKADQVPHQSSANNIRATYSLTVKDYDSITGQPGPQGPVGPAGPQGDPGAAGPAGPQGVAGATGPAGPTGGVGPKGDTGAAGPAGPQGLVGPAGSTGAAGPQGLKGDTGATGPQGLMGFPGLRGETGATGAAGATGPAGPQGPAGPAGPQGPVGPQGPAAPSGTFAGSRRLQCVAGIGTPCTVVHRFSFASSEKMVAVCSSNPSSGNYARFYLESTTNSYPSFSVNSSGATAQSTAVLVPMGPPDTDLRGLTISAMARGETTAPNLALQTTTSCYFGYSAVEHIEYD